MNRYKLVREMTRKKWLTDEISNIDAILAMKDQIITLLQFFCSAFLFSWQISSPMYGATTEPYSLEEVNQ